MTFPTSPELVNSLLRLTIYMGQHAHLSNLTSYNKQTHTCYGKCCGRLAKEATMAVPWHEGIHHANLFLNHIQGYARPSKRLMDEPHSPRPCIEEAANLTVDLSSLPPC